ncbi:hypothetical protein [Rhizobacter sp. Root404]|jgi:hypothetical protein|uniref:hypothetical protein n=1 Tax=Rhizobacter sp. Root404 TaxID=1736528 RepID=UPI0006F22F18|nr:hypothetical protein [Rhizobacter sp. Root404]KQW38037.1 hypothetical protein ASC76_08180 [Rhizobacter sp. Root404]
MNAILIPPPAVPWWRVGVMWLFVGGLGTVVVASLALVGTAVRGADPVMPQVAARVAPSDPAAAPALIGRNHAASPLRPRPAP